MSDAKPTTGSTDDLERLSLESERMVVELLPDGRIRAPSSDTRSLLKSRLTRAEILPTGPGWLVSRSLDALPDVAPGDREVVCAGTMSQAGVSLIDFIGFLATGYQTGVVTVSSGEVDRSIFFHQGNVVWASSTSPGDRLGEFLLRRGKITREQLQTAVRRGEARIGRACVECGFIAPHELWSVVQAQLTEIFDAMLRTEDGVWTFARISSEALAESKIHLSTQGLLVDALRRLDEMKVFRERIRSSEVIVERGAGDSTRVADLREVDGDEAHALLRHLARPASIQELMRFMGRSEFDVTRLVFHLMKAELVAAVDSPSEPPMRRGCDPVSLSRAAEVVEVYTMALREMVQELGPRSNALLQAAHGFMTDPNQRCAEILGGVQLHSDGTIDEPTILALTEERSIGVHQLSEALSELMFFVLFQTTDLLGHRKGDDLARRVKIILALLDR